MVKKNGHSDRGRESDVYDIKCGLNNTEQIEKESGPPLKRPVINLDAGEAGLEEKKNLVSSVTKVGG